MNTPMNTTVKNPTTRNGVPGFSTCTFCKGTFTRLGLPRHWNHCDARFETLNARARQLASNSTQKATP